MNKKSTIGTKEKQPDDQVKVQIAKCPFCGNPVRMTVIRPGKPFDKTTLKEYSELMTDGCTIMRVSLLDARKMKLCFMNCDEPLVVKRKVIVEKKKTSKKPLKKNRV